MTYDIRAKVKGIIFDLDGTLVDSLPYHFMAWKTAAARYGAEVSTSFLDRHNGTASLDIATEMIREYDLSLKVSREKLLEEKTYEFSKLQHLIKPIMPVAALAIKYYQKLPVGIGTGGHRKAVERTLEAAKLSEYFKVIVTADDITNFKPHPETFIKCSILMKVDPSDIEVFEDTDQGIEAALNAGMKPTDVRTWFSKA